MSKKMTMLYVGAHLLVLALLLSFVFIAAPTTDDYAFAVAARKNSIWDVMVNMFQGWGGRYIQAMVATVWYKLGDMVYLPYSAGLLLFIMILFSGIYFFMSEIFRNVLGRAGVLVVSAVILAGLLRGFPTLDESIYWNIGGITYLLPAALFLHLLALGLYSYRNGSPIILQPILCLLVVFIAGINEAFVVMNVLAILGFIVYMKLSGRMKWSYLFALLAALLGVGLIIISKGNSARMGYYPQAGRLLYSLFWGSLSGTQALLQGLVDPYVWGSLLLLVSLFYRVRDRMSLSASMNILTIVYSVTYILMLYATVAVHYYGTGNRPVQRLMVAWYIIFYLGLIPLACFLAPALAQLYNFMEKVFMRLTSNRISMSSTLFALVMVAFLLINNPPKAVYDLVYNVPGFVREIDKFNRDVQALQKSAERPKNFVVEKFKYRPKLLKAPTDVDYGIGPYYGFDSVKIVPRREE